MKKWIISLIALCLIGSIGMFYVTKQNVDAEGIVLSKKVFSATFSEPVSEQDLQNGNVYLQDINGKNIDANFVLSKDGKSLEIADLEDGNYVLFVKKKYGMGKSRYTFTVTNEIPTINTKDELTAYFDKVRKTNAGKNSPMKETEEGTESSDVGLEYSTTNNLVEGVEEADVVKTDGKHIYTLSQGKVSIVNIENPNEMQKISSISFDREFYPSQLLLSDNVLMVIGQKTYYQTVLVKGENEEEKDLSEEEEPETIEVPLKPMTAVYFYDISNPKYPSQKREMASEGNLNGVRLKDKMLYLVTTSTPSYWEMEKEEEVELRPYVFDSNRGKKAKILGYGSIAILPNSLEGNYTLISGLDITNLEANKVNIKSFLGSSDQLYMSKENLYLTTHLNKFEKSNAGLLASTPENVETEVYKFALNDKPVEFKGSHRLEGTVLNEYAMDEYNGYFRTVTSKDDSLVKDESSSESLAEQASEEHSENRLYVLDKDMKPISSLTGLANGKKINSARFMGDRAYMVTSKETDPLYAVDLADPNSIKVLGELNIPGFNNYLHSLDENHLIGFGYETNVSSKEGAEQTIQLGEMKVSLFDITDLTKPVEVDSVIIGGRGTYSAVHHDYQALFLDDEKQLYGFPISIYSQTQGKNYHDFQQEGAILLEITPENGISLKAELWNQWKDSQKQPNWDMMVQRVLTVDDTIFTVGAKKINSYRYNDFEKVSDVTY